MYERADARERKRMGECDCVDEREEENVCACEREKKCVHVIERERKT